jgi:hypothetical protein
MFSVSVGSGDGDGDVVVDAIVVVYHNNYFYYNSYSHRYNLLHILFLSTTNLETIVFIIMITSYHYLLVLFATLCRFQPDERGNIKFTTSFTTSLSSALKLCGEKLNLYLR